MALHQGIRRRSIPPTVALLLLALVFMPSTSAGWWSSSSDEPASEEATVEQVVEASVSTDGKVEIQAECSAAADGSTTCTSETSTGATDNEGEPEDSMNTNAKAVEGDAVTSDGQAEVVLEEEKKPAEPLPWGQTHIDWPQLPVVFHNDDMKETIELHFQTKGDEEDMHFGEVPPGEARQFQTYHGAAWYITEPGKQTKLQTLYVVDDDGKDDYHFDSREVRERKNAELREQEQAFKTKYLEEKGTPWIAQYPRDPPIYHMYEAKNVGDVTTVRSNSLRWYKDGPLPDVSDKEPPEDEQLEFRVETLSLTPKVFAIHNVLSKDECDFMVERSKLPGRLQRSLVTTKAVVSSVRTSSNAWFPVEESPVIENIFNRIADVLHMPRHRLRHNQCAENIQLVYYNTTQEYRKHHDYLDPRTFRDSANVQRGNNRFATILFYLNEIEEGGQTFFPRSEQGKDFGVKLPVGSAVLFYSMLEDGNLDVMSEHGGAPVTKGEKYVANLWVWEPRWV